MNQSQIESHLPGVIQRTISPGNPLESILLVMETLLNPTESILENIDTIFDPRRTPDRYVPFLSAWLDLDWLLGEPVALSDKAGDQAEPISTGTGRLRELIASASYLSKWRGTRKGMIRFLEVATGMTGFVIEEEVQDSNRRPLPFHIAVHAPESVSNHRALLESIVEMEKPAYVTYSLEFDQNSTGDN